MPLTAKGSTIKSAMEREYGANGERVFYASKNAGTITGVDMDERTDASGLVYVSRSKLMSKIRDGEWEALQDIPGPSSSRRSVELRNTRTGKTITVSVENDADASSLLDAAVAACDALVARVDAMCARVDAESLSEELSRRKKELSAAEKSGDRYAIEAARLELRKLQGEIDLRKERK